ncbi:hypothetical protein [Streptomyces lancefieldiae]|uniref:Helix-turn-helix domain-containing protein n=1 Tax=Streptomyces lancefieldiae TaxID=3075520 RepID=A0ABU3ARE2_9ACTN|nr:hypothetical protein [Streptomyces sp. DSM 40712]MDT0612739.1 hypothetical protein [Streptomyces sp. DSM 40712]
MSRPGSSGLRFGMFAVCVSRDSDPGLNAGKAKPLYDLLVTYADVGSRDTGQGYPYREALASCLDCSKQTVDRAADYLEKEIGLVTVHRRKVEGKPEENDANLYEIHDAWLIHGVTPPAGTPPQLVARYGHTVPGLDVDAWISKHAPGFDLADWRAAYDEKLRAQEAKREEQRRRERARRKKSKKGGDVMGDATPGGGTPEGGGVMGDATGGVTGDASDGVMGDALSKAVAPDPSSREEPAPSARSAGDVRRTGAGSSARGRSGSAASGKDGSSSRKGGKAWVPGQRDPADVTGKQTAAVHAVEALLPPPLVAELPYGHIPRRNRTAVLEALESRTVEQLRERITARWTTYGYEPALHDGRLRSAVGVALELIAPTPYCPDPSCEDGVMIDTREECRACSERRETRRADRLAGRTPPAGGSGAGKARAPECLDCGRPFPGAVPAEGVCRRCTDEATAAFAALAAGLPRQAPQQQSPQRQALPRQASPRQEDDTAMEREALEPVVKRRRARRAAEAAPAVEDVASEAAAAAAEEDTRLRAELLAANPWMADYAQPPAGASPGSTLF